MTFSYAGARFSVTVLTLAIAAVLTALWLISSPGEAFGQSQGNGNGTPLVLADIDILEIADQQRFDDTEAANQTRLVAIENANQVRFAAIEQENQARADVLEVLIEARIQEVKDDINNRADVMDSLLVDLDALLFDTHLVDELDMEITA